MLRINTGVFTMQFQRRKEELTLKEPNVEKPTKD